MGRAISVVRRTLEIDFITSVEMRSHKVPTFKDLSFANGELFWVAPVFGVRVSDDPSVISKSSNPMNGCPVTNRASWA